jgi:thiosulfate/3-mercaptopyruvate sulfurtransferase
LFPLVTPAWLAAQLRDPATAYKLVLLDATLPPVGVTPPVDTHARYLASHLPGARFFDIEAISDHATPLPHMLPTAESFSASMFALGVSDDSLIVVYEQEGVFSAPRAWWMLRTFGAQRVHILDGGLKAWLASGFPAEAGHPTESGPVSEAHPPATFHARLNEEAVIDYSQLQNQLAAHRQIVDARSAGRFSGAAPEPRPGLSSGHMPGATSLPFTELVDQGRLKDPTQLREIFAAKGIDTAKPITTTCGSGVTAAVLSLALEILEAPKVALYDGSWSEYAQNPASLIEK